MLHEARIWWDRMNQLTPRENEVAALAAAGLQAKEIGDRLGIAEGTAKLHLHNIYTKLGIHSRVKLALTWLKHQQET
jgi:DNA-binding NarL/FixJ family response regulator